MVVLGIDPGLANTGFGVVARRSGRLAALDGGVIETRAGVPPERRLAGLHQRVRDLLDEHEPDAVALEALYFGQNVAHRVRGRAGARRVLVAAGERGIRASTTRPSRSRARSAAAAAPPKDQVQRMVQTLLRAARAAAARPRRRRARRGDLPRQPRAAARAVGLRGRA